ncbi:hypothetical protein [uncultured Olleya sp.]|uniref:hypothetical protein n=1 Tax=uncultured Olleya sp. TaxID=757243 RepID=UPI002596B7B3|nr:hypothetical protein [uncultured Olleya sp.]
MFFVVLDLENTNFKALKKTQYNIAKRIKIENQNIASIKIKNRKSKTEVTIQNKNDTTIPIITFSVSIVGTCISGNEPAEDI